MTSTTPCPHCGEPINPASLMGKLSAQKRDISSDTMRELQQKRVYQVGGKNRRNEN